MDAILEALAAQHADLGTLLHDLDEAGWDAPTRCEGWTVADVVLHMAQTDALGIASATGRFAEEAQARAASMGPSGTVDDWADQAVAAERGGPGAAIGDRWESTAAELRRVLAACDPHERVQWVAGQLSVQTLAATRLAECWIHSGDVAEAVGRPVVATDRLRHIARLAWRTLPYAFQRDGRPAPGPTAFHVVGPDGETWDLVPDEEPVNVLRGDALDLCLVAGRRKEPVDTGLVAEGPDAEAVLALVRTYA